MSKSTRCPVRSSFWSLSSSGGAAHIFAHAVAGGVFSVLQGGKFGHGFVAAGVTKGFDANFDIDGKGPGAFFGETAAAAIVGGTVSEMTGGKFANGATTAAFQHLFNELSDKKNNANQEDQARKGRVFRALDEADRDRLDNGLGLAAKNPYGVWDAETHVLLGSTSEAKNYDPWISTTTEIDVSRGFDSGYGIVAIDLSKIETEIVTFEKLGNAWANKYDFWQKIVYHRAMWQQEVLIKGYVPRDAITPLYEVKKNP